MIGNCRISIDWIIRGASSDLLLSLPSFLTEVKVA